jgi:hypothetical protein
MAWSNSRANLGRRSRLGPSPSSPYISIIDNECIAHPPTYPQNLLRLHPRRNQTLPQPRRQTARILTPHELPMDVADIREEIRPTVFRMQLLVLRMHARTFTFQLSIQTHSETIGSFTHLPRDKRLHEKRKSRPACKCAQRIRNTRSREKTKGTRGSGSAVCQSV